MITRQYKWQLKQLKLKHCVVCGKKAITKRHCKKHAEKQNIYVKRSKAI